MNSIPYRQALATILEHCAPLPVEEVGFHEALGRVLASDIHAQSDDPPAPKSAMDGFALRSGETREAAAGSPVAFTYRETVGAGHPGGSRVEAGTAVRIMTGALLPRGADAVVKQEHTRSAGEGRFTLTGPLRPGENVISVGASLRAGQRLLPAGGNITPQGLGLLASQGIARVPVRRRPRVALLALGDELVEVGEALQAGQVYVSNLYALEALCGKDGAETVRLGIAADDPALIEGKLRACLPGAGQATAGEACDLIVTIGGSHRGDFDFAEQVLARLEARLHFRRIRLNLGGSTLFASREGTLFFGLPGTPMASWLAYEVLVRPALWRLAGREGRTRPLLRARLAEPLTVSPGRTHFIPGRVELSPHAEPIVTPLTRGAALALPPSLLANGLIHWPEDASALEAGASVPVEWLGEP